MGAQMLGVRSAKLAVCGQVRMESFAVFTRWGMIGDSAGHSAQGLNIVTG